MSEKKETKKPVEDVKTEEPKKPPSKDKSVPKKEAPKKETPKKPTPKKGKWLYQGKELTDNDVRALLEKRLNKDAAEKEMNLIKKVGTYASAVIGFITYLGE